MPETQEDLFPGETGPPASDFWRAPVAAIRGGENVQVQPELLRSIEQLGGIVVPVLLRIADDDTDGYRIIDGRRRVQAARHLGIRNVPAVVFSRTISPRRVNSIALTANFARSHNVMSEVEAIENLVMSSGMTVDEIAERLGLSRALVRSRWRFFSLIPALRERVREGVISLSAARVAAGLSRVAQMRIDADDHIRWTARSIREEFNLVEEDSQLDILPPPDPGWANVLLLVEQALLAMPEPESTNQSEVDEMLEIGVRLNEVLDLLTAYATN